MELIEELAEMVSAGDISPDEYEEALCDSELAQSLIRYFIAEE